MNRKKFLFSFIIVFFLFVFLELCCRMLFSQPKVINYVVYNYCGEPCDNFFRLQWINNQKNISGVYYNFDQFDPILGWRLKENIKNVRVFNDKILNSNSDGIRGDIEYEIPKPASLVRVAVLGDSFTFGEEVSDNETYPFFLNKMVGNSKFEVMNFGIHGYGHDQMLITLRERVIKYRPNIVIIGYINLDLPRNTMSFRDYAKPYFTLNKENKLILQTNHLMPPSQMIKNEIYRLKIIDLYKLFERKLFFDQHQQYTHDLSMKLLEEIVLEIKDSNAVPVIVHLPIIAHKRSPSYELDLFDLNEKLNSEEEDMYEFCKKHHISYIQTRSAIARAKKNGVNLSDITVNSHWSPVIYKIIAHEIRQYLFKRQLLSIE